MAYANQEDYISWLKGRGATVPLAEFDFWAERASEEIDSATFNRLREPETLAEHEPEVIKTTIALAEFIFNQESPNAKKELSGYSIGRYSESYVSRESKTPQERLASVMRHGLAMTGLLYRGA